MRQTSLLAYNSLGDKINERQRQVLHALEDIYPANNRQLSEHSRLPINVVTPRMNELVSKGRVTEAFRKSDPITGRLSIYWKPAVTQTKEWDGDAS
jgi:hypothetical protein